METSGLFRDGKFLVAEKRAIFPDRCVFCAGPAGGRKQRLKYFFDEGLTTLASNKSGFGLVASSGLQTALKVGICRTCNFMSRMSLWFALGLLILGLAFGIIAAIATPEQNETYKAFYTIMFVLFLASIFSGAYLALCYKRPLKETSTHKGFVWLDGASPKFLADLPEFTPRKEN